MAQAPNPTRVMQKSRLPSCVVVCGVRIMVAPVDVLCEGRLSRAGGTLHYPIVQFLPTTFGEKKLELELGACALRLTHALS
jgi:hypothetical protein